MLCHADSTHSWQHAQLTANDFPSQLNQLIKKFADQLISHAADSFWWFPTQQKDSADFLRDRQLLQLMQLISHAAKRCSWFPVFQTASDSAYFLRCRQLRIRLFSHVQTASDLLIQLISKPGIRPQSQLIFYVTESFWFSWFPTWQTASGFIWLTRGTVAVNF